MRPIKLVISAFGPYKDKHEINFEKLGSNGIFLITGDTGSGKTTIFDAICFALFGEASGSRREASGFRSDFASLDINTYVILEFYHKGIIYKVERNPSYSRKKKRGEGYTNINGDATLSYNDIVVTGDKNVTLACEDILGMNISQFRQVSMIAQGEFLELLLAKTKDRATIFRHIFDTSIYKSISDKLKEKYLVKKREYEDSTLLGSSYIKNINLSFELNGNENTDKVLELIDIELNKDIEELHRLEKEKKLIDKNITKLIKTISEAKIVNTSIENVSTLKIELDKILINNEAINKKEVLVKANNDIWNLIMPKYKEVENTKNNINIKKNNLKISKNELNNILDDYNKYSTLKLENNKKLDKKFIYLDNIKKYREKLELLKEIDNLDKDIDKYSKMKLFSKLEESKKILKDILLCNSKKEELLKKKEYLVRLKDEYVDLNNKYIKAYELFLEAQAGLLASTLKKGMPCPVCGSLEHPVLAKKLDNVLTKEEIDELHNNLELKNKEIEELRLSLKYSEKEIEELENKNTYIDIEVLEEEISSLEKECNDIEINNDIEISNIDNILLELNTKKEYQLNILNGLKEKEVLLKIKENEELVSKLDDEIKEIEDKYNELAEEKNKLESLILVLNNDREKLNKDLDNYIASYENTYKDLGYSKEEDYLNIKLDINEVKDIEREVIEYKDKVLELKSKIKGLEETIDGREYIDTTNFNKELNIYKEKQDDIELSLKEVNAKIINNKKIFANLKDVSNKSRDLEKEVMLYKDLSDTANGNIVGKNKMEFEQYVQTSYFDRVLVSANKRFSYMTDSRYQLFRKVEMKRLSDKLGLELEVMDYYTGKKRDVKSLSGGEAFKASLALALGMSDVIQEFAGGIVVEAMFIDEGFGSLDETSLEQAISAIMMLSQNDKLIGIISHVDELKNRIDKKIVVKKSSTGSSINIVV